MSIIKTLIEESFSSGILGEVRDDKELGDTWKAVMKMTLALVAALFLTFAIIFVLYITFPYSIGLIIPFIIAVVIVKKI